MEALEAIYKKSFFSRRYKLHWRAEHVVNALLFCFPKTKSYVDVGCATGDLVAEMGKRAVTSHGIEGSNNCAEFLVSRNVTFRDLREPFWSSDKFDLCSCFEVLEHIEEEYSDIVVDNLCDLSKMLVVSAAPPGQEGHHHVNCQCPSYWKEKFYRRGYDHQPVATYIFKEQLAPWKNKPGIKAFYENTMVFRRS